MADSKITALTALTAADPVNDMFPIVDVSDTTMAASGTTKKISVNNILGASGTATLASATITGDLTVDTSTLKVDSTNNRVGIGTASPTQALSVNGAIDFKAYVAHMDNFAVYAHSSDGTILSSFTGYPICFRVANSEKARIDTSGNLLVGTASTSGSSSNATSVVLGSARSADGSVSATTAVATTIFSITAGLRGRYEVVAAIPNSGSAALYTSIATVIWDGSTGRIVANNGTNLTITLSGSDVQITQTAGTTQTVYWSFLRISLA